MNHRTTAPFVGALVASVVTALAALVPAATASAPAATAATAATTPCPRVGVYNHWDPDHDSDAVRQFGATPEVANSYYQPTERVRLAKETARIQRGTSPNITITTTGTNYIEVLGTGPAHPRWAEVSAWLTRYLTDVSTLADVDPSVPVYATIEHEFRVKVRIGQVTGLSADPDLYGRALDRFFALAAAKNPRLRTSYWMAGYDRAFEGRVAQQFRALPEAILFDPYASAAGASVTSIAAADVDWIRAQDWYIGQEIGFGEFGARISMGDDAMARFFTDVRSQLTAMGVSWAVLFNRQKDFDTRIAERTDGKTFPKAQRAFSVEAQRTDACTPPEPCPGLGVYNYADPDRDTAAVRQFGVTPQLATSYYRSGRRIDLVDETERIRRGTSPNITISTVGTDHLAVLGTGPTHPRWAEASAWLQRHVTDLATLAAVDPHVPVYATLESEFVAKVRSGRLSGPSADPVLYGRALDRFYALAAARSATLRPTYWMTGQNRTVEGAVARELTTPPAAVLFTEYARLATDTVASIAGADLTWLRAQEWYAGQEIGFGSFGARVGMGDDALERFFSGVRGKLEDLGVSWAVLYNRARTTPDTKIAERTAAPYYPQARTAYSVASQQAENC